MSIVRKIIVIFPFYLIFIWVGVGTAADGIQFDRFKVQPAFSVEFIHTDNFFTTEDDEHDEFITNFSPELNFYFSLDPGSELSIEYEGDFKVYRENDQFDNSHHAADVAWSLRKPSGSNFRLGGGVEDSAIQPYREDDTEKEYIITKAFLDSDVRAGGITAFDFGYEFVQRSFEESINEQDEFSRHRARIGVVYDKYALTSLVSRYIYEIQDNNDLNDLSTDMYTHTLLVGIRRKQEARLSGSLMAGYTFTEVEDYQNFNGVTFNGDLTYELSPISNLTLAFDRRVIKSTIAERETNIYYNSTRGSMNLSIKRWSQLEFNWSILYRNNAYDGSYEEGGNRSDNLFGMAFRINYYPTTILMISIEYRYRNNDSNKDTFSYEQNTGLFLLNFSI